MSGINFSAITFFLDFDGVGFFFIDIDFDDTDFKDVDDDSKGDGFVDIVCGFIIFLL